MAAMTAAAVDAPWSRDEELLAGWQEMDVPEGWRAEIIFDGTITVSPPPLKPHSWIDSLLNRILVPAAPAGTCIAHQLAVRIPSTGKLYEPDLVVLPDKVLNVDGSWVQADDVLLVVEITSEGNADVDRKWKRKGYALGGVPLYLLVDRWCRPAAVTLLSEPSGDDYRQAVQVPFGQGIVLPEPFDVEIDTSEFQPGRQR